MPAADSPYHHGDLRRALLDAGLGLLKEGGPDAVTMREVARRAGVSHAAPYHHFADKAALIEAMAVLGFEKLTVALERAASTKGLDALEQFRRTGMAYARFALNHHELFRLMNRPEMRQDASIVEATRTAYAVIERAVVRCQEAGIIAPGPSEPYALTAWAAVHGGVILALDGLYTGTVMSARKTEALVHAITEVLGSGLMAR